jgi:hypothetical protein
LGTNLSDGRACPGNVATGLRARDIKSTKLAMIDRFASRIVAGEEIGAVPIGELKE